jgi:hypothetical protein
MIARLLLAALFIPAAAFADDWLKEPPQKLVLKIGGKEVPMVVGKAQKIEGEFKDPVVTIEAASVRSFDCAGIKFDYPAGYNWEAEGAEATHTWTMEGPDVTVIMTHADADVKAGDLAESLAKPKGRKAVKTAITETHGGREFKGWKIAAIISNIPMNFRVFSIPLKKGSLVMQIIDSPENAKEDTPEFRTTMELLGKTLRIAGE